MLAAPTLDLYESETRCPFNLSTAAVSSRGSMALSSGPSHLNHSRHASTVPQPLSSRQRAAPRRAGLQPRPGPAAFRVRAARPVSIPSPHRHRSSGEDPLPVDRRPTNGVLAHTGRELTCSNSPGLDSVLPDGADPRNRLAPSRKSPGRGRGRGRGRRSRPADAAGCRRPVRRHACGASHGSGGGHRPWSTDAPPSRCRPGPRQWCRRRGSGPGRGWWCARSACCHRTPGHCSCRRCGGGPGRPCGGCGCGCGWAQSGTSASIGIAGSCQVVCAPRLLT